MKNKQKEVSSCPYLDFGDLDWWWTVVPEAESFLAQPAAAFNAVRCAERPLPGVIWTHLPLHSMCPPFHTGLKEASGMCRKLFFVTSSRSYLLSHSPLEVFNLYNIFESHKGAKKGKEKKCWYSGGTLKVVVGDHERTHKSREAINVMCVRLEGGKKERKGRKQAT